MVAWMGMAIDATSRLGMAGVVSMHRDRDLADRLLQQVRACCQCVRALLVCTDGWNAYPKSILRVCARKSKAESRTRKSMFGRMGAAVYRYRDQAHEKEAGGGSYPQDHLGNA